MQRVDAVIIGAGFSGLYMLHRLRQLGMSVRVFEAGSGVGGTWFWNRYPGARCDVESLQYSYSFSDELQQEWCWTERYPRQPEILRYLDHVADRFDLRRDIQLGTRVVSAVYNEAARCWTIATDRGDTIETVFCIMATGTLSTPKDPGIPGFELFRGAVYRTSSWPAEEIDFSGKRVGVIGTGSTGLQVIPAVARQAEHVTVFQRTPNFSVPAQNGPIDEERQRFFKANYAELRQQARNSRVGLWAERGQKAALEVAAEERDREFERRWQIGGSQFMLAFTDLIFHKDANEAAAEFVRNKIRATVKDPAVADRLLPKDHPIGTRRLCVDTEYYETYNRPNVTLVDLRAEPLLGTTPAGVQTSSHEYPLDALILATGFDAMTGTLKRIDIRGRSDRSLRAEWEHGPRSYLGLMVAGFPNLFIVTGPGSPSVLTNIATSIEQHVEWISDCIRWLRENRRSTIEASEQAQDEWVAHVSELAHRTLYPLAKSWYMGANIPGKPRVFMPYIGGLDTYRRACDEIVADSYRGFLVDAAMASPTQAVA